jgi:DNA-binding SARP family transcriptional activator
MTDTPATTAVDVASLIDTVSQHRRLGRTTAAIATATSALELMDEGASKDRGTALRLLGLARRDSGDIDAALEAHTQAEYVFATIGDGQSQVREHVSLGKLHLEQGRLEDAQAAFVRVLDSRTPASDLAPVLIAQAGLVEVRARRGDTADAIDTLTSGLAMVRADSLQDAEAASLGAIAFVEGLNGDVAKADEAYTQAVAILRARGSHRATAALHAQVAERRAVRGDIAGAQQAVRAAESVLSAGKDPSTVAAIAVARGSILEQTGDLTAALAAYWEAVDAARRSGATYADRKAAVLSAQLDPDQARAVGYLRTALLALAREGDRALFILRPAIAMWLNERLASVGIRAEDRPAVDALLTVPAPAETKAAAGGLQVSMLGSLDVRVGGERISDRAWRTSKAKELFSLLLMHRDRALGRDEIIERLWPETEPGSGISNFHFTVHALRKALGTMKGAAAPTVRTEGGYQLITTEKAPVDVDVFQLLLHEAHRFRRAGRPDDSVRLFRATTALYRGDLLTDLESEWVAERREDLLRQYLSALRQLAELEVEREEAAAAVAPCRQYLEREPYDEHVHRLLMRAYHASGDGALMERHYRALVTTLKRELDASPEAETTKLFESLRSRQPAARGVLAPVRAVSRAR